eukprot:gene17220-19632_t
MDGPAIDQPVTSTKKRVRRNALKPNSAESDSLREFSIMHTLSSKIDLDGKDGAEEQKGDDEESTEGSVPEKRQKLPQLERVESARRLSSATFPSFESSEESESCAVVEPEEIATSDLPAVDSDLSKVEPNSDACKDKEAPIMKIP